MQKKDYYISSVFRRIPDSRLCTMIVAPVKAQTGEITGYMGTSVLVERMGKRLAALNFGEETVEQVLDASGMPLFDQNLQPNVAGVREDPGLVAKLREANSGHFQYGNDLVTYEKTDGSNWTALLKQPVSVAYKPVHDLVEKTAAIAAWLVALYAVGSWLMSWLYRNHLLAAERIAQETSFSQTILANMPIGIALLDSVTRKCLQGNAKFLEMARKFGGAAQGKQVEDLHVRRPCPAAPGGSGGRSQRLGRALPPAGAGSAGRGEEDALPLRASYPAAGCGRACPRHAAAAGGYDPRGGDPAWS